MKSKVANSLVTDTDLETIASVIDEAIEWGKVYRSIEVEDLVRRLCKKYYLLSTGRRSNF